MTAQEKIADMHRTGKQKHAEDAARLADLAEQYASPKYEAVTESGDRIQIGQAPQKPWHIADEGASAPNGLYTKWRDLRARSVDHLANIEDARAALAALVCQADKARVQGLLDGNPAPADALDKQVAAQTARIAALETEALAFPAALRNLAQAWAAAAAEFWLRRLHESSIKADEVAGRIETMLPALILEWREHAETQHRIGGKLSYLARETAGRFTAPNVRYLPNKSLGGDLMVYAKNNVAELRCASPGRQNFNGCGGGYGAVR